MKFAVALIAITLFSQTSLPALAQESDDLAFGANLDGASVNAVGGGSMSAKPVFTDEQKEKFYELKNSLLNDIGPKRAELGAQKRALKDLLTKDTLDRKAVQATQDKINALVADLSNRKLSYRMDVQDQLTSDQKKAIRYRSLKKHHGRGHHKMRRGGFPRANQGGSNQQADQGDSEPMVSHSNIPAPIPSAEPASPAPEQATVVEQGNI